MKKTVTGSHSGTGWWLAQRITAVVMFFSGLVLLVGFLQASPFDHASWRGAFSNMGIRMLVWLLVASLCFHAWIGLRDVLMDYVKPIILRLALNVVFIMTLAGCVLWITEILWGVHG